MMGDKGRSIRGKKEKKKLPDRPETARQKGTLADGFPFTTRDRRVLRTSHVGSPGSPSD